MTPLCTCTWEDVGDAENGPRPVIVELNPNCPDPEHRQAFKDDEAYAAGYEASLRSKPNNHQKKGS